MDYAESLKAILKELEDNDFPVPIALRSAVATTEPRTRGRRKGAVAGVDFVKSPDACGRGRKVGFTKATGLVFKVPTGRRKGAVAGVDFISSGPGWLAKSERILYLRLQEGLRVQAVADQVGCSKQYVSVVVQEFNRYLGGVYGERSKEDIG